MVTALTETAVSSSTRSCALPRFAVKMRAFHRPGEIKTDLSKPIPAQFPECTKLTPDTPWLQNVYTFLDRVPGHADLLRSTLSAGSVYSAFDNDFLFWGMNNLDKEHPVIVLASNGHHFAAATTVNMVGTLMSGDPGKGFNLENRFLRFRTDQIASDSGLTDFQSTSLTSMVNVCVRLWRRGIPNNMEMMEKHTMLSRQGLYRLIQDIGGDKVALELGAALREERLPVLRELLKREGRTLDLDRLSYLLRRTGDETDRNHLYTWLSNTARINTGVKRAFKIIMRNDPLSLRKKHLVELTEGKTDYSTEYLLAELNKRGDIISRNSLQEWLRKKGRHDKTLANIHAVSTANSTCKHKYKPERWKQILAIVAAMTPQDENYTVSYIARKLTESGDPVKEPILRNWFENHSKKNKAVAQVFANTKLNLGIISREANIRAIENALPEGQTEYDMPYLVAKLHEKSDNIDTEVLGVWFRKRYDNDPWFRQTHLRAMYEASRHKQIINLLRGLSISELRTLRPAELYKRMEVSTSAWCLWKKAHGFDLSEAKLWPDFYMADFAGGDDQITELSDQLALMHLVECDDEKRYGIQFLGDALNDCSLFDRARQFLDREFLRAHTPSISATDDLRQKCFFTLSFPEQTAIKTFNRMLIEEVTPVAPRIEARKRSLASGPEDATAGPETLTQPQNTFDIKTSVTNIYAVTQGKNPASAVSQIYALGSHMSDPLVRRLMLNLLSCNTPSVRQAASAALSRGQKQAPKEGPAV